MKKLSKLLAVMAGFGTLFFAGCSDVSDRNATVSSDVNFRTGIATDYAITFCTDGTEESLPMESLGISANKSDSARTIVADALDLAKDEMFFYIWATNEVTGVTEDKATLVTFVADPATGDNPVTTGTVTLDYPASKYYFVLAATTAKVTSLDKDEIIGKAVYRGYANVDLRNGDTIKFYISSDGLKGKGAYSLTIRNDNSWTDEHIAKVSTDSSYTISTVLTNRTTNGVITGTSGSVTKADFFGTGAVASKDNLEPGTYNFIVMFAVGTKSYEYSDLIIILPNRTVTKTIEIPDVIEYEPTTPQGFHVAYIKPSVSTDAEYKVVLEWTDKSSNEKAFKIEYIDVTEVTETYVSAAKAEKFIAWQKIEATYDESDSDQKDIKDAAIDAWDDAANEASTSYTCDSSFYGNADQKWIAGSLQRNNTGAVIRVPLGKRFWFRVAAVNDATPVAGPSEWAYATYGANVTYNKLTNASTLDGLSRYEGVAFTTTKALDEVVETTLDKAKDARNNVPTITFYKEEECTTAYTSTELSADAATDDSTTPAFYKSKKYVENWDDDNNPSTAEVPVISITANLYRLTYYLNGGTYEYLEEGTAVSTTKDIVEYKSQGEVPLLCPYAPVSGTSPLTGAEYPKLYDSNSKRWTGWKKESIAGDNYGTQNIINESGVNYIFNNPGTYQNFVTDADAGLVLNTDLPNGYANLSLFATYSSSNGVVDAYNDALYDLVDTVVGTETTVAAAKADLTPNLTYYSDKACTKALSTTDIAALEDTDKVYTSATVVLGSAAKADTTQTYYTDEICRTKATIVTAADVAADATLTETSDTAVFYLPGITVTPIIAVTNTTGVTKDATRTYTVKSSVDAVELKYGGTVSYTSLSAVVTRLGKTVASGDFSNGSTGNTYSIPTESLALGTYRITVYAVYKGRTYSYPIQMTIED